jgi:hypothetical protein
MQFVWLGFDWGYRAIEKLYGQPEQQAMSQGLLAILVLGHVVFPLNMGLSFACFRRYFNKRRPWALTMFACTTLALWFGYKETISPDVAPEFWGWTGLATVVAGVSYTLGYRVLRRFYKYWNVRLGGFINMRRALPDCAIYLLPSMILGLFVFCQVDTELPLWLETLAYGLPLFVIGFRAVRTSRSLILALLASGMILSPVIVIDVLNLFGTTLGTVLDALGFGPQLGWRAALSATMIAGLTVGATALGCICASIKDEVGRRRVV